MLGVKDFGRIPMAWDIRPGFRGDLTLCDDEKNLLPGGSIAYEPGENLHGGAQNRVLCAA